VWAGISRRGTTSILIVDDIMNSSFYIDSILTLGLLSFIKRNDLPLNGGLHEFF